MGMTFKEPVLLYIISRRSNIFLFEMSSLIQDTCRPVSEQPLSIFYNGINLIYNGVFTIFQGTLMVFQGEGKILVGILLNTVLLFAMLYNFFFGVLLFFIYIFSFIVCIICALVIIATRIYKCYYNPSFRQIGAASRIER